MRRKGRPQAATLFPMACSLRARTGRAVWPNVAGVTPSLAKETNRLGQQSGGPLLQPWQGG